VSDELSLVRTAREYAPGLSLLVVGAGLARVAGSRVPGVNELLVAIVIGVVLTNAIGLTTWMRRGVRTHNLWLGAGIVLMGASLALDTIVESGAVVVVSVLAVTLFTLVYVEALARVVFDLGERLGSLLAAGSSICGVSAVVAVAGSIEAKEEHLAYAAATVLLFDAITLLAYPVIGRVLELPAQVFGMWAGLSMFSTGPVVAVGFEHSNAAGQWATVTKLTRNALIGVVAVGYATYYARRRMDTDGSSSVQWRELWDRFPKFVLGFLALALIASGGVFSAGQLVSMETAYGWLFLLAFVGLGTDLELQKLRCAGVRPVLVVLLAFATVSVVSLAGLRTVVG